MLSDKVMKVWIILGLLVFVTGVAKTLHKTERETMTACFVKNIHLCGDMICESDNENPIDTLRDMHTNLQDCLDNGVEDMFYTEEYFNMTLK